MKLNFIDHRSSKQLQDTAERNRKGKPYKERWRGREILVFHASPGRNKELKKGNVQAEVRSQAQQGPAPLIEMHTKTPRAQDVLAAATLKGDSLSRRRRTTSPPPRGRFDYHT